MSKGTRAFNFYDAVVDTLQATTGLSQPGGTGIPVYDGPVITDAPPNLYIIIGADDLDSDLPNEVSFTVDSTWRAAPISVKGRSEEIILTGVIIARDGRPNWKSLRTSVDSTFDTVTNALLTVSSFGLSDVVSIVLDAMSLSQTTTENGFEARLTFTFSASFIL